MVDGLENHQVNLGIGVAHGEASSVGAFVPDAQDDGRPSARVCAVNGNVQGEIKPHVEAQHTAGAHQLKHTLLVLGFKAAVTLDEAALFAEEQDERFVVDEWETPILTWLEESQIA